MLKTNPKTIWNSEQNKPTLVVDDIIEMLSHTELGYHMNSDELEPGLRNDLYRILLDRGVFKWLAVRRDLIKLKNKWKAQIALSYKLQFEERWHGVTLAYRRGFRDGLEQARAEVRALCHSERWRAPDNDRRAQEWLSKASS